METLTSTREIAVKYKRTHQSICITTREMLFKLQLDSLDYKKSYTDDVGRLKTEYMLTPDLVMTLTSVYDINARHALVQYWQNSIKINP